MSVCLYDWSKAFSLSLLKEARRTSFECNWYIFLLNVIWIHQFVYYLLVFDTRINESSQRLKISCRSESSNISLVVLYILIRTQIKCNFYFVEGMTLLIAVQTNWMLTSVLIISWLRNYVRNNGTLTMISFPGYLSRW